MKKAFKILAMLAASIAVLALAISFTIGWRPFIGPRARPLTDRKFEATPARLARGDYLVNHAAGCMDCHSPHDWTQRNIPVPSGALGSGQDFNMLKGLPGLVYAPNITPDPETGAGSWTDDMLARAIREGIGHDGRALFPMMPYQHYRAFSDEDVASIVVYLRSLPPVRKQQPPTRLIFPVNYLIRGVPRPLNTPVLPPDFSTPEKRGAFLVNIGGCGDCHTPEDNHGNPLPGMDFSGGQIFDGPWGRVASANITQDPSGIPYYDEAMFSEAITKGHVKARALNQFMPWNLYSGMTDQDVAAIFAYIKTVQPVRHRVDNSLPATYCRLCRQMHGGGDQN